MLPMKEKISCDEPTECSDEKHDFSKLPPEILLMIFKHLHKEDACVKNLTETCSTFNNILRSRLRLTINLNDLRNIENLPELTRPYDTIHIYGNNFKPKFRRSRL